MVKAKGFCLLLLSVATGLLACKDSRRHLGTLANEDRVFLQGLRWDDCGDESLLHYSQALVDAYTQGNFSTYRVRLSSTHELVKLYRDESGLQIASRELDIFWRRSSVADLLLYNNKTASYQLIKLDHGPSLEDICRGM